MIKESGKSAFIYIFGREYAMIDVLIIIRGML